MKQYDDFNDQNHISGSQPHKSVVRKNLGKGKKLHSFKKDESLIDDFSKGRASYKRAENKNFMRSQLLDIQLAF